MLKDLDNLMASMDLCQALEVLGVRQLDQLLKRVSPIVVKILISDLVRKSLEHRLDLVLVRRALSCMSQLCRVRDGHGKIVSGTSFALDIAAHIVYHQGVVAALLQFVELV